MNSWARHSTSLPDAARSERVRALLLQETGLAEFCSPGMVAKAQRFGFESIFVPRSVTGGGLAILVDGRSPFVADARVSGESGQLLSVRRLNGGGRIATYGFHDQQSLGSEVLH